MFKKIIFTGLLLASAINAHAANSAPFGVTGTITPATCGVTFTGGVVNLGVISTVTMRSNAVRGGINSTYDLPSIYVPFNITCSAATSVQVAFIDNYAGKNIPMDAADGQRYGMVDGAGSAAIGSIQMEFTDQLIDGTPLGQFLISPTGTTAWAALNPVGWGAGYTVPGYKVGFAKLAGATTPDSLTTLSGNIRFKIFLGKNYVDSATNAITPNASGTLSLVYL